MRAASRKRSWRDSWSGGAGGIRDVFVRVMGHTRSHREDRMTERTSRQLNDVNLEAIGSLIEKIRREPEAAKTQWKADVRWTGAFRSEARSRDLGPSPSDEPSALGGSNTAP